jgi:DNA-binding LacI/PurR family transcriptional regulator
MATRRRVAEAAGVSMRTVSNVVNGFVHVSDSTRARVLQVIQELDYRPSELARSLKAGRSGLIGLVLPELDTPYFAELTRAFVEEGKRHGLTVVIDQTDGDREREQHFIDRTYEGALFDALVISPLGITPDDVVDVGSDRPLVFLGETAFPRFDHVMIDNRAAAQEAVAHLALSGRRRIAAIGAEETPHASGSLRLAGYFDALRNCGLPQDHSLVERVSSFRRASGAQAMARLLERPDPPDAVFCFSDPLALGSLRTLLTHGVRVPEDVAVVGFDDVEDGQFSVPSLTSISPDKRFIAATALASLSAKLNGTATKEGTQTIAPHVLRVRESSGMRY